MLSRTFPMECAVYCPAPHTEAVDAERERERGKRAAEEAGNSGGAEERGADIIFDGLPPNLLGAPEGWSRHPGMGVSQALHLCDCVCGMSCMCDNNVMCVCKVVCVQSRVCVCDNTGTCVLRHMRACDDHEQQYGPPVSPPSSTAFTLKNIYIKISVSSKTTIFTR